MKKTEKIFVAGHKGLVGSAIVRALQKQGYTNLITKNRRELELLDNTTVKTFFAQEKPEYVFLAAAKVGGIMANSTYPADFIYQNLVVQNNVIHNAYLAGVKKLLFLGSSCIYPRNCPQPIKESYLLTGELEPTNEAYAIAKIAGIAMCQAYNKQHSANFISLMPTNLYGPNDNFDLENSHVLPALIRKFHDANVNHKKEMTLWGTGIPKREFLHVDDLATACIFLMNNYDTPEIINVGTGEDIAIKDLAEMIKKIVGYRGKITWDSTKPDGMPRKLLDVSKINALGWRYKINLEIGIGSTYEWFKKKWYHKDMIVTRTPFRVTLGGGGTDLPSYYEKYGGFIFSAGIDKYMIVTVNRPIIDDLIRLKYSETEVVEKLNELKHDIAREALRFSGIDNAIEVNSIADISAGTGLGSSSCYTVGLLHALHTLKRDYVTPQELAEEDFKIEREILGRPIGKQDPYLAAFGGMFVMEIATDGKVTYRRANVSDGTADDLNRNMMLFFTGKTRRADDILKEQEAGVNKEASQKKKDVTESMHYIKQIGYEILEAVEDGDLDEVGKLFDAHWQHKKRTSSKMTNPEFDKIYDLAKESGALGGKISGAGGGGFFTFYVPDNHAKFIQTMEKLGLRRMRYRFDFEGSKVLVNI